MYLRGQHTPEPLGMVSMGRLHVEPGALVETLGFVHEEGRLGS
jgi:hypothetical protein